LLGNKVPAAILDPPYTTMAAKEGYKLLVDPAPMDVPYLRNIVAVSEKSLREDSRTVSRFVAALAEGMQFKSQQVEQGRKHQDLGQVLAHAIGEKPRDD
jgi:ABC-type nitrate/sulfonate/bicarbonate transport system substrate-binding protein